MADATNKNDLYKLLFDHLKHVGTLATGSILLLVTMLDKMFPAPVQQWLVPVSLGALLLSLVASLIAAAVYLLTYPQHADLPDPPASVQLGALLSLFTLWASFVVGIGSIAVFFLINWFAKR